MIQGAVERMEPERLSGWAVSQEDADDILLIEVFVRRRLRGSNAASLPGPRLSGHPAAAAHGFLVEFAHPLDRSDFGQIEVYATARNGERALLPASAGGVEASAPIPGPAVSPDHAMAGMLDGKAALITGGGGGIGRATALAFAREGARLAVADFVAEWAEETVAMVNQAGGQAISLSGDVTDDTAMRGMVEAALAAYGRLDCAFNNAGIAPYQVEASGKKTAEWSEASFDRMIAVNLKAVWLAMRHEIPQMVRQGGGAIVNTGSIAGLIGLPTSSAYVAAKHGVLGLTKTAALEYAEAKVRVNAVCPGFIKTRMTEDTMRRRGAQLLAQTPMARMGEPQEIAEMVVWLSSDRASYVTGACYNVDGGWMAY